MFKEIILSNSNKKNSKSLYFKDLSKRMKENKMKNIKNKSYLALEKILGYKQLNRDYSLYAFNKPFLISEFNNIKFHLTPNLKAKILSPSESLFYERYHNNSMVNDDFSRMFLPKKRNDNKNILIPKFIKSEKNLFVNKRKFRNNFLSIVGKGIISNKQVIF